jgi:glycosyltransferase involved in cell wall biosynthesis
VCWSGHVGGAETFFADLAIALRSRGVDPGAVIVGPDGPVSSRFDAAGIRRTTLWFERGSRVLRRPRRFAEAVTCAGEDGAILQTDGYLAAALRAGGYPGTIIAVQHGAVMHRPWLSLRRRLIRELDQLSGVWALDALVAVSNSAMRVALRHPHPRRTLSIYNGVDVRRFRPIERSIDNSGLIVGFAGRLINGKGTEVLLYALRQIEDQSLTVEIAGDGPERRALESLTHRLGITSRVRFRGLVADMPAFWQGCDIAAVPSHPPHVESFGLVAVEAMAAGLPVVAASNGALPEIVQDGRSGTIVPENDPASLAEALEMYAADRECRARHGREARADCEQRFGIDRCASAYVELLHALRPASVWDVVS